MWLCVFVSPSTHVLTEDVVYREVTADHRLLSRRLLMKTDQSIASLGGAALPRRHVSLCVRHRGLHRGPSEQEPDHLHLEPQPHNSHGEALCCCFFPAVYSLSCFREILIDTQPVSCVMPFSWWVLIIIAFVTLCGGEKLNFSLDSACFSAEVAVKVDMCCLCFVFFTCETV